MLAGALIASRHGAPHRVLHFFGAVAMLYRRRCSAARCCFLSLDGEIAQWHDVCGVQNPKTGVQGDLITIDTMDNLARLAGALSLLVSWKMRPWRRAREKVARHPVVRGAREATAASRPDASWRRWADAFIGGLWAALLLFVLGYLALYGDVVVAELDGIILATPYSMEP